MERYDQERERPDLVDVYSIERHDGRVPNVRPPAQCICDDGRGAIANAVEPSEAGRVRSGKGFQQWFESRSHHLRSA